MWVSRIVLLVIALDRGLSSRGMKTASFLRSFRSHGPGLAQHSGRSCCSPCSGAGLPAQARLRDDYRRRDGVHLEPAAQALGRGFPDYELFPAFVLSCLVIVVASLLTTPARRGSDGGVRPGRGNGRRRDGARRRQIAAVPHAFCHSPLPALKTKRAERPPRLRFSKKHIIEKAAPQAFPPAGAAF